MAELKKNIVILGGGFGGLKCALYLAKKINKSYQVILVDKNKYHTYHPLLYEIATANLDRLRRIDFEKLEEAAAIPFKEILRKKKIKFIQNEVINIDIKNNLIILKNQQTMVFEYLVFALGSETNYFNISKASEKSLTLKTLDDAMNIRNALDELFYIKKPKEKIKIVIVGGGFTGCELSSELAYFVKKLSLIHNFPAEQIEITVIEASKNILPGASEKLANLVHKRLKYLKINLLLEQAIQKIEEKNVYTHKGGVFEFDQLIWATGVQSNNFIKNINGLPLAKNSCLVVNAYLQINSMPKIFGLGDNIYCPVIATAQAALDQAKIVAQNIINLINKKDLKPYKPRQPFFAIPLGGKYALIDLKILILKGWIAWFFKHLINLKYFLSILTFKKALTLWLFGLKLFQKND